MQKGGVDARQNLPRITPGRLVMVTKSVTICSITTMDTAGLPAVTPVPTIP